MKKNFSMNRYAAALTLFAALSFSSCAKPTTEKPNGGGTADANTVSGIALDAQGKPLAGVKVRAENPTGNNIYIDGTTGSDGRYKLKLSSIGGWKIYAWKEVQYQDKVYHLRLGMKNDADYDAFSTDDKAIVKDFVWKLNGRIPDRPASIENGSGYFGASLRLVNYNNIVPVMPAGTKVTVTLTPVSSAKYLDGTAAIAPVVKTFTVQDGNSNYYMADIPVTEYHISVQSECNGKTAKVYVGANSSSNLTEWVEFYFDPAASSSGSYESGLKSPDEFPFYLGQKN